MKKSTLFNGDNLYYFIDNHANVETIDTAIFESDSIWHFLCVLSDFNLNDVNKNLLNEKNFEDIAKSAKVIFLNGYDGEGYIAWSCSDHFL